MQANERKVNIEGVNTKKKPRKRAGSPTKGDYVGPWAGYKHEVATKAQNVEETNE